MRLADADRLLDPTPMPLELGWERLDDGVLHVAIRTDLHRCTGAMLEWWFRFRPGTREYRWWHPIDHISSEWVGGSEATHIGSTHIVEERCTERPAQNLLIQFRDPGETFDTAKLAQARADGAVSGIVVARGTAVGQERRTAADAVIGTRLIHLARDTEWGMVLRTHFFLGADLPGVGVPSARMAEMFPEEQAPNLIRHCYDEFTFLSRFLPSLYMAENRDTIAVVRPW